MKKLLILTPTFLLLLSCSQEKRLIHKAEVATERMEYDQAIAYYDEVLEKNSNSYRANAGKGMVLSEFTEQYDKAIPYLEKALSESPKDTLANLNYNLGKSYHITAQYNKALVYYGKLKNYNEVGDPTFGYVLTKSIADCNYALAHPKVAEPSEQNIKNVGTPVNTPMPEYGAVMVGNDMIFTSKRKDDEKEKKNGWDGKYFESMYISTLQDGKFTEPRRYTLPDLDENSEFQKHNEAVISASPDGKKLYVYRDAEIYEADITNPKLEPDNMGRSINFARFQSHAYLAGNNDKLFFTSESKRGLGGTDIYVSDKVDGKWTKPVLLDTGVVNTDFNEDAPYYSADGTLYFSSNGLPGYGGYDVYKTRYVDGHWTTPENLGQPVNSPADDIFFVLNGNTSNGYYSSARVGGSGNMDIYKVHYVSPETPECETNDPMLAIDASPIENSVYNYKVALQMPAEYTAKSFSWTLNGQPMQETTQNFDYSFAGPGTYTITAKAVLTCDTCPVLHAACTEKTLSVGDNMFAKTQDSIKQFNSMMSLNTVYFDYDRSNLRSDAISVLEKNIAILKGDKNLNFVITGHADSRGREDYNKHLSVQRADAVKQYLVNKGISRRRISGVYGAGETPLANGCADEVPCTEEQHQENRRVEFKVVIQQKPFVAN